MKVSRGRKLRGDPVETAKRMAHELRPVRFSDTLRRMIEARRLSRNGLYSNLYVTPHYLWVVVPEAWKVIATIIHVPFDQASALRMTESLRKSPHLVSGSRGDLTECINVGPDTPALEAIRLKVPGFLGERELAALGFHKFEVKVWTPLGQWESPR